MFFEKFIKDLPEKPVFNHFPLKDVNPLAGTTKIRIIEAPNAAMYELHRRFVLWLRQYTKNLPYAVGSLPGGSPLKNVQLHKDDRYFYVVDISGAYKSVELKKMADVLCSFKPELDGLYEYDEMLEFLKRYCFSVVSEGLIMGSPSSPDLFNLYAGELIDEQLGIFCERRSVKYSRYLDDLLFSSQEPIGKDKRRIIRDVIEISGLKVNHRKAKVLDLSKGTIIINGIGLEFGGRTFLPRSYARKLERLLHRALTYGDVLPEKIHGMMGAFWQATGRDKELNKTELGLVEEYECFKESLVIKKGK